MNDYIKREDVRAMLERLSDKCGNDEMAFAFHCAANVVKDMTAADVVEVVRCRDCKYYNTVRLRGLDGDVHEVKHCNRFGFAYKPNDFCPYGERRSE